MGYEGIRGRTGARAWEVIHIYTGSFTPSPGPYPLLPPPDLDKEGRVDNQRDTPPNTRLTVQPIRATSLGSLEHGKWLAETTVPVGCFVFHKANEDPTGTIEDHLAPMVKMAWPERYAEAEGFVDDNKDATDKVSDKEAERIG